MAFATLKEMFDSSISRFADNDSFSMYERERMSYAQLGQKVDLLRETLLGAGLNAGDKVALLSNSMPNWGVCYFAVVTAGMVIVPILPDFTGPELDMIIEHSQAKALMVSDKLFSKLSRTTVEQMNIVVRTKNLGIISRTNFDKGEAKEPAADDLAAIIYTSGTTSKPKGVMLSHANLCAQAEMSYNLFPIAPDDRFLSILPLAHTYECSIGMIYPFAYGASVTYLDRPPTPSYLHKAASALHPSVMLSVPLIIEKIFRAQVVRRFESNGFLRWIYSKAMLRHVIHRTAGRKLMKFLGDRIRFFGIGGAKLDGQTEQFLLDAHFPYAIGYGLTETAPLLAGAAPSMVRLQSTGPMLEGVSVRFENVNPDTGEGEIVVKSPSTMIGYYKNPQATAEVFTPDGWFRTKDLGCLDADGYLYIKGRATNMILGPSGENIYPEEIESVINSYSLVVESLVTQHDGKLVALVKFNSDELERKYYDLKDNLSAKIEDIKEDLKRYVNEKVNKFSRITSVEAQDNDFEKTPTHKIKRYLYTSKDKDKKKQN